MAYGGPPRSHGDGERPARVASRLRLAQGTPGWLAGLWAGAGAATWRLVGSGRGAPAAVAALGSAAAATWFFRDPDRRTGASAVVAPADGTVTRVDRLGDGRLRIVTYLNLLDVHVNRAPVSGAVVALTHRPGGYVPAFRKESERNERLVWSIRTELGDVEMVQIAGTVARRIVPYLGSDAGVTRGDRIGLIRFGSRVVLHLPGHLQPYVAAHDRVRAGTTPLADA
jgi:phosphatidylserine decarboxylase